MKSIKFLYLLSFCVILYSCSNEEPIAKTACGDDDGVIVYQERDPSLPEVHASPVLLDADGLSRAQSSYIGDSRLGYSYTVGNSILGNQENVISKVIDIDIVRNLDPECINSDGLDHFDSDKYTYSDYDSYESHLTQTEKVHHGFKIDLFGLFKIGRKKENEKTFTTDITSSNSAVFGELSMVYENSLYTLLSADGDRKFYARECLSKSFKQNLYSSTIGSIIDSYGEFVLTGYVTGGKAFALYAGIGDKDKTVSGRNDDLSKDIGLSFSWKKDSAGAHGYFGNNNGDFTSILYNTDKIYTRLFIWGGNSQGIGFENAVNLKNISIDLDPWINSLNDENTHGIIDITRNGLYPISDFIIEKNFSERMSSTISGFLPAAPEFMTPRIDIMRVMTRGDSNGNALYDIAPVLFTRQGDRIVLRTHNKFELTDAELRENSNASVFTQKAAEIAEQKKNLYGLRIRSVSTITLNPQMATPLCFDLGEVCETEMYTYVNRSTNMEYIYDPVRKIALSLYVGSRDGDVILDDYGIRDWVESLPTKAISLANLANNYTIIGL